MSTIKFVIFLPILTFTYSLSYAETERERWNIFRLKLSEGTQQLIEDNMIYPDYLAKTRPNTFCDYLTFMMDDANWNGYQTIYEQARRSPNYSNIKDELDNHFKKTSERRKQTIIAVAECQRVLNGLK